MSEGGRDYYKERLERQAREKRTHQRRKLAGALGLAAAASLAGAGIYEINQPPHYTPDEVETGPVVIQTNAVLRSEPFVPDRLSADEGIADNSVSRDNLTLEGHPLKDEKLSIKNMLIVSMPSGEKWGILEGVKEGDKQESPLFIQLAEKGVEHPVINAFANLQPDGSARTNSGTVIPKDQIEKVEFSK